MDVITDTEDNPSVEERLATIETDIHWLKSSMRTLFYLWLIAIGADITPFIL